VNGARPDCLPTPAKPRSTWSCPSRPSLSRRSHARRGQAGSWRSGRRTLHLRQQVLARLDPKSGDWFRLPNDAPLMAGDNLLVFPTYRPQITLVSGVQLTLWASRSSSCAHDERAWRI